MAQKLILTIEQHRLIINTILKEIINDINNNTINENQNLEEGVWEKVKYGLSKLGRYKADGKIFGKGKIDQAAAEKIQNIISKKGNQIIAKLDSEIKATNPKFPNNEKEVIFLNTILGISAVYDSIIASTQKNPNEEGYLPIDAANGIINDLREYVKKFLDVDLKAVYSVVDEIEGNVVGLTEEEEVELNEMWDLNEYGEDSGGQDMTWGMYNRDNNLGLSIDQRMMSSWNVAVNITDNLPDSYVEDDVESAVTNYINDSAINQEVANRYMKNDDWWGDLYYNINDIRRKRGVNEATYSFDAQNSGNPQKTDLSKSDISKTVRGHLQGKKGQGKDFDSERMKTLKSNKLPLTLMGVGSALGGFSWLVNTEWFKGLFDTITQTTDIETVKQAVESKAEVLAAIKPGQGLTQIMNELNNAGLTPNSTPEEFLAQVKSLGGGNLQDGINALTQEGGIFKTPNEAKIALMDIAKNPHRYGDSLSEIFGEIYGHNMAGTGKQIGDVLVTVEGGQLKAMIVKTIIQAVPKIITNTAIKTGAGYAVAKGFASVLGPIGVGLLAAGALVKLMRMKGQRQSRAKTLNDLYQSIRNIEGGAGIVEPQGEIIDSVSAKDPNAINDKNSGNNVPRGTSGTSGSVSGDELYNSLRNLFQFIVNNRKMLGTRANDNVGTGGAIANGRMRAGNTYNYNGQPVTIVNPDLGDGRAQVRSQNKAKNIFTVPVSGLQKMNESQLFEGQYITDKRMVQFLNKNLSFDKLKSFETLMNSVELLRNKIKKLNPSDKVLAGHIKGFNNNPIMATDFKKMFNLSADNPKAANSLKAFIDDLFITLYSGKYKFGSMIDKMATLGGGNINKVDEGDGYDVTNANKTFAKDAQDRGRFKANLLKFLSNAMNLFQYLSKLKKEGKLSSVTGKQSGGQQGTQQGGQQGGQQQQATEPSGSDNTEKNKPAHRPFKPVRYESINEEIDRIKKIMLEQG